MTGPSGSGTEPDNDLPEQSLRANNTNHQRKRKNNALRFGAIAEQLCRLILRLKGYRVLASRLRTKVGEIDILAERVASSL